MTTSAETTELTIDLQPPIDLPASLRPLGRWGDDGIDRWDGTMLVRAAIADGHLVPYVARVAGDIDQPSLRVTAGVAGSTEVAAEIRGTFFAAPSELDTLAAVDDRVQHLVREYPGIIPVLIPDPFTALIRSISAQQVNLRWAATVRRRLAERFGARHEVAGAYVYSMHPTPLAAATIEELRALQLTTAKARSVIAVAQAANAGALDRDRLAALGDEELIAHLTTLRGIGRWSAEWFLARTLGRPRVVAGDLGVRKAVGRMYGCDGLPSEEEVRRLTAHWGAAATHVQALALQDLAREADGAGR